MNSTPETKIEQRVNAALWEGAMTRLVRIGAGAVAAVPDCLDQCFSSERAVVVADKNTYAAAGRAVRQTLESAGREVLEPFLFDDDVYAEHRFVEQLQAFLQGVEAIPVAVGSGTINDLTKLASHRCNRPYLTVATAASMDGYTAFGASITREGYKQTMSCPAPLAVAVDLDVLADAPPEMNAAGYADLVAKIPAGADWLLADAAGVEPIEPESWRLVQTHLREWTNRPAGVRSGDRAAMALLAEGLIMTGLGMQRARSSRPASGADHQFSHLWDMQHHTHDGGAPMHGCKVAIGTLASAAMYQQALALSANEIVADPAAIEARWPRWETISADVRSIFTEASLAEQVLEQSRAKYAEPAELAARLERLKDCWNDLRARLREQLIPPRRLREMLSEAGAPSRPEDIGISRPRLHASYRQAQRIRSRYTILDLINEADWWAPCVDALFEQDGFWADN